MYAVLSVCRDKDRGKFVHTLKCIMKMYGGTGDKIPGILNLCTIHMWWPFS